MRFFVPLALLLSVTTCFKKFPEEDASGVYACNSDSDCTRDFFCSHGKCIDPALGPRCPEPSVSALTESPDVYVGLSLSASAEASSSDTECPIVDAIQWVVCGAPEGSAFATTDGTCTPLATGSSVTLSPDVHGAYALTARATAGDATGEAVITVNAKADSLFVSLSVYDASLANSFFHSLLGPNCWNLSQADCANDSTCTYDSALQTCWTNCSAYDNETDCSARDTQCSWDTSCTSQLNAGLACITKSTEAECNALPSCSYKAQSGLCGGNCAAQTDEASCESAACGWDSANSTCSSVPDTLFATSTIAELWSDGSDLEPLHYGGAGVYRYDPNGIFTSAQLGTGLEPTAYGLAFDSTTRRALVPHLYLFTKSGNQCAYTSTMMFWEGGDGLGVNGPRTRTVQKSTQIQGNITDGSSGTGYLVGAPDIGLLANGSTRFVFGESSRVPDQVDCVDDSQKQYAFTFLPLFDAALNSPLQNRTAMPIVIGQVTTDSAVQYPFKARIPCDADAECGSSVTCASGVCASAVQVEGYLPRLHAEGEVVTWSRATCAGGFGAACQGDVATTYDLMLAHVSAVGSPPTSFSVDALAKLSADPQLDELDAFIPPSILQGAGTAYYLASRKNVVTVNVSDSGSTSTTTVTIPTVGLYARDLQYVPGTPATWSVDATQRAVVSGAITTSDVTAYPCNLGDVQNRQVLTQAHIRNVQQFTFSPDGHYLAYAVVEGDTECQTTNVFTADAVLKLNAVASSKLQIIDLGTFDQAAVDLIPAACTGLGPISTMPRFIADGQQIVFNNAFTGDLATGRRFFRMNVDDVGSTTCPLVELGAEQQASAKLSTIDARYTAAGVALADSRTGLTNCQCSGIDGSFAFVGAIIGALWRAARRKARGG